MRNVDLKTELVARNQILTLVYARREGCQICRIGCTNYCTRNLGLKTCIRSVLSEQKKN